MSVDPLTQTTLSPDLTDKSGNILPPQMQQQADAFWSYYQATHIKTLVAEILSAMLEQGKLPPPELENMAFGDDDESADDLQSGDDELGDDGDDLDGDSDIVEDEEEVEELDEDDSDDDEEDDPKTKTKELTVSKKKEGDVANYESENGKVIAHLTASLKALEAKLAAAEQAGATAGIHAELATLNYELSDEQKAPLVGVLSELPEDKRRVVLDSLKAASPKGNPVAAPEDLNTLMYGGSGASIKPKGSANLGANDWVRIGEIAYEKGISLEKATLEYRATKK